MLSACQSMAGEKRLDQYARTVGSVLTQAVAAAKEAWGQRQLKELDAEERLSMACEKAPTSDPATSKLRAAFQVPPSLLPAHSHGAHQSAVIADWKLSNTPTSSLMECSPSRSGRGAITSHSYQEEHTA